MGDYDYLDDMFANAYRPQGGGEEEEGRSRPQWQGAMTRPNSQRKVVPKKDFLRKNSPPKSLHRMKREGVNEDRKGQVKKKEGERFITNKKMNKKQMRELVRIYGTKEEGPGIYGDFGAVSPKSTKKSQTFKPSEELMKKSLSESSIPIPASIPAELTYANTYSHLEKQPEVKIKKKKGKKKRKGKDPEYAVGGMQFDPLSATERHYHQQENFAPVDKKSITFNEFSEALNDSAVNVPRDGKKNTFQISSILKSNSKVSKNLNESMQYSYLFSPKKTEDNPTAGMDFEKIQNQEKDSLSLLEQQNKPVLTVKLAGGSDMHNFPEWTGLRDNYIQQLQNLNYHQDLVQNSDMISDISIPNFIGLLLAIRKISFRIVDKYRQVILYDEKHENFKEMNDYIIKMATDVNCINRQPFVNWMGISPIYNTFFAERKIDGTSALFADRAEQPKGLKFQGEYQNTKNNELRDDLYKELYAKKPVYMRNELLMTTKEKHMVDELGGVIWNAYCTYQEALHHKRAAEVIEGMISIDRRENFDNENISYIPDNNGSYQSNNMDESMLETGGALENPSVIMNTVSNYSAVSTFTSIRPMHIKNHLAVSWRKWRRLYLIRNGLRNLTEGRLYCIKRKVMDGWQKYSWQNMEFRRLQQRRWTQLLTLTFDGWFQYLHWCRKFNRVLLMANHENMRRVLKRMRIFSLYVHDNRNFKWRQFHMPLIITFRALKHNASINKFIMSQKLKRASQFTFSELNLRKFFFDKWCHFKSISIATETIDVALIVWSLRDVINEWKSLAWSRQYKSRRNLRIFKKGLFRQTTSFMAGGEESNDSDIDVKNDYLWPKQEKYGVYSSPEVDNYARKHQDSQQESPEDHFTQDQWQLAALGEGGSEMGSGSEGNKSVSSKKSWFSFSTPLLSKK